MPESVFRADYVPSILATSPLAYRTIPHPRTHRRPRIMSHDLSDDERRLLKKAYDHGLRPYIIEPSEREARDSLIKRGLFEKRPQKEQKPAVEVIQITEAGKSLAATLPDSETQK